jgi:hypothetical protein
MKSISVDLFCIHSFYLDKNTIKDNFFIHVETVVVWKRKTPLMRNNKHSMPLINIKEDKKFLGQSYYHNTLRFFFCSQIRAQLENQRRETERLQSHLLGDSNRSFSTVSFSSPTKSAFSTVSASELPATNANRRAFELVPP